MNERPCRAAAWAVPRRVMTGAPITSPSRLGRLPVVSWARLGASWRVLGRAYTVKAARNRRTASTGSPEAHPSSPIVPA